jgi:demethylmenaquinone methyltransferase/2-methoxy-6-polyprenyl-1,4-benzoquinol methylase
MRLHEVAENYDRAAPSYDYLFQFAFSHIMRIEDYRAKAVDLLGDIRGGTVLDVGCGTGVNFPLLAPRLGAHGQILGVDYSEGMLRQARKRLRRPDRPEVRLQRGDAVTLDGVDGPVDGILSAYCMGIVYDIEAALERSLELLRPGGRLAILDFGRTKPQKGVFRALYPLASAIAQRQGVDTQEDLDDQRRQEHWAIGRSVLQRALTDVHEERFFHGMGLLIGGKKR